jgi:ABC-type multidrug transport system permease subunit
MLLAFVQVVVILALIDAFAVGNLAILLVAAVLGGLMFSGVAMFVGSMGKDFMGTLTWMMLFILPLAIPSVASLFPGSAPLWVRLVPSYSLIDILNRAANYGALWRDVAPAFGVLVAWLAVLFGLGWFTLSRKVARL